MPVRTVRAAASLLLPALFAAVGPAPALAQEDADAWQWRGTLYAWLPDIEIESGFPTGAGGSIDIDADTLLRNLDFTFMAALQVRKGSWGGFTDLIYLNEGASRSNLREFTLGPADIPAGVTLDAGYDLKSWVWTLGGTYSLNATERHQSDLLLGFRMLDLEQTLDWSFNGDISGLPVPGPSGSSRASGTSWDAIIGLKGLVAFGANGSWLLPYHVDVGAGDADFTWQAMAGIGYQFDWGALLLAYRHLDYEFDSGSAVGAMDFSGPMLGGSFTW